MSKKKKEQRELSAQNCIGMYLHCGMCLDEWKNGMAFGESPESYQRMQAGWTKEGLQLRCTRHRVNIIHIDFEGIKHPANLTAGEPEIEENEKAKH